jgi:ATP-dependent DNA ligase
LRDAGECVSQFEGEAAIIFEHTCKMGIEGTVPQRRDLPYRNGRVRSWIKVKNPASAAVLRIAEVGAGRASACQCQRWDNVQNTYWDSMGRSRQVGHDNLLTILVTSAPLLGTTGKIRV